MGNLFCGTLATIFAVGGHFEMTALFVALGIFLDFFDGFFARILNVSGELGKQLDSLADMVTSGVVPGIVLFVLLGNNQEMPYRNICRIQDINGASFNGLTRNISSLLSIG